MAKKILSAFRTIWYIFCVAIVAAFAFSVFRWLRGDSIVTQDIILDCFTAFGVTFIAISTICIIRLMIIGRRSHMISERALAEGVSDDAIEYYKKLCRRAKHSDSRLEAQLMLASAYAEALRYDEAFEVLAGIDLSGADSDVMRASFFNTAVYIYLMSGDFATAERLYVSGKPLLDKYSQSVKNDFSAEICHTVAAMEYARGNIYQAEQMFNEIVRVTRSERIASACGIYLVMIYLATDRTEEAKTTAEAVFPTVSCYRDRQNILRLMRCIENAYGVYSMHNAVI